MRRWRGWRVRRSVRTLVGLGMAGLLAAILVGPRAAAQRDFYLDRLRSGQEALRSGDAVGAADELRVAAFGFLDSPMLLEEALAHLALAQAALHRAADLDTNLARFMEIEERFHSWSSVKVDPATRSAFERLLALKLGGEAPLRSFLTVKRPDPPPPPSPRPEATPPPEPTSSPKATPSPEPTPTPMSPPEHPAVPAVPGTTAETALPDQPAVLAAVEYWAASWSSRDVAAYLACYSGDFRPAGDASRGAWEGQRRARILGTRRIEIVLSDLQVSWLEAGDARVKFRQTYKSERFSDTTRKVLVLRKGTDGWKIVTEEVDG
jgi:ketosteroid isomerase-like protein